MTKSATILVCCHKQDIMATQAPYMPIHVGKDLHPELNLGIQTDNTGDNISIKNESYCELTGMYWAWKNLKDVDIIGLCHYRRYFDFHHQTTPISNTQAYKTTDFPQINLNIPQAILDKLKDGQAIVPKAGHLFETVLLHYCYAHLSDDIHSLKKLIEQQFPEYIHDLHKS